MSSQTHSQTHLVGKVRPSQVLWTYGPGSLIDLPNLSVLTAGLDSWRRDNCSLLNEPRLLAAVKRSLGPQVEQLRVPPAIREERADPNTPEGWVGVPVRPFPRWLRCVQCGYLNDVDSETFRIRSNFYRPDQTHYQHVNCERTRPKPGDAVPVRFLTACRAGHLDEFPWRWFVHQGPSDCTGTLYFFERGASLQTENLWVKCSGCDKARSLVHAFGKDSVANLPACRGRHPHLDTCDDKPCNERLRTILLGATNCWFPMTASVIAIPTEDHALRQFVKDNWNVFKDAPTQDVLGYVVKAIANSSGMSGINKYRLEDLWQTIVDIRNEAPTGGAVHDADIKEPEWRALTSDSPPSDMPFFLSKKTGIPFGFESKIHDVLLLERLREVNALIGFTRIEAAEESTDSSERPPMARLTRRPPTWVPAGEVHGEGFFIRFKEDAIAKWEALVSVRARDLEIREGHKGWRSARKLNPNNGYPGIRYAMLHTLAHLLIRELALECGYNASSIKERIYAKPDPDLPMAGILIYTAAADSDGTLGGLVDLGKPESLCRLLRQGLERAKICSSDPLCSEHKPKSDRSLHAASCHACGFIAETSCERGNRYLDRALLVPTFESQDIGFFMAGIS